MYFETGTFHRSPRGEKLEFIAVRNKKYIFWNPVGCVEIYEHGLMRNILPWVTPEPVIAMKRYLAIYDDGSYHFGEDSAFRGNRPFSECIIYYDSSLALPDRFSIGGYNVHKQTPGGEPKRKHEGIAC